MRKLVVMMLVVLSLTTMVASVARAENGTGPTPWSISRWTFR